MVTAYEICLKDLFRWNYTADENFEHKIKCQ